MQQFLSRVKIALYIIHFRLFGLTISDQGLMKLTSSRKLLTVAGKIQFNFQIFSHV